MEQSHRNFNHATSSDAAELTKFAVMSIENQMDQNTESSSNRAEEVTSPFVRRGNLKRKGPSKLLRRVSFEPLALLLDAAIEGELDLVERTAREVTCSFDVIIILMSLFHD